MAAEPSTRTPGGFPVREQGYSAEQSREIGLQLLKINQSGPFFRSRQMQNLLEFLVREVIAGRHDGLKETSIGNAVFNRPATYDPKVDSVVRLEARRLRAKLSEYYLKEGELDGVLIELNKGGYVPSLTFRNTAVQQSEAIAPPPLEKARHRFKPIGIVAAGVLLCLVLTAAIVLRSRSKTGVPEDHSIRSIAVLPFIYRSGAPDDEYFGAGVSDALITRLAQISSLTVVSTMSAMQYQDAHKPLPQIAHELNVDAVVEGSITRFGKKIRIFAKLLDARANRYTWAESFEDDESNPLALQDRVARTINDQITARLPGKRSDPHAPQTPVVFEAYDAYLKGKYFLEKRTSADMQRSFDCFQQAISLDSRYASAYAGLADWYHLSPDFDLLTQKEGAEKALEYAAKATLLDPLLAEPYAIRAAIGAGRAWNWTEAEANYLQAIKLDPGSARARSGYSSFLSIMARHRESIQQMERAMRLDPLSSPINGQMGIAYYLARENAKAAEQFGRTIAQDPFFGLAHKRLALVYEQQGLYRQADAEFLEWGPLVNQIDYDSVRARYYALIGNRAEAKRMLAGLLAKKTSKDLAPADFAMLYAALGDRDNAMKWLEQGYAERDVGLTLIAVDPRYDPLRTDTRFQELLKRMNLPASPNQK